MFESHSQAILELCRDHHLVPADTLDDVNEEHKATGKAVADLLVEMELVDKETILRKIAEHLGCEYLDTHGGDIPNDIVNAVQGSLARMYRVANRKARVEQALKDLGLADRAHQLAGSLSGGWKQRLALAACLIHDPQLLLLDEPTAGVDPKARRDFWDEIRRLSGEGVTVLVSTHYMDEAVQCDFIAYIAYGKKLIDGPSAEIPAQIGLITYDVEGPDLVGLEARLKREPGVEQVARFGASLHVSGTDRQKLEATVERLRAEGTHDWRLEKAGLEEAFIYLMAGARDNFAGAGSAAA